MGHVNVLHMTLNFPYWKVISGKCFPPLDISSGCRIYDFFSFSFFQKCHSAVSVKNIDQAATPFQVKIKLKVSKRYLRVSGKVRRKEEGTA